MFSDMVPVTLEAVKETCRLNHLSHFDTCTLDWSEAIESKERYDLVLGCEVFYEEAILTDISHVLEKMLTSGGKGLFCDPNRLGLDTITLAFQEKFNLSIDQIPLNWSRRKGANLDKMVYLYTFTRRGERRV